MLGKRTSISYYMKSCFSPYQAHLQVALYFMFLVTSFSAFSALMVGLQEGIWLVKNMGDGGGGHWFVRMEWRPAGWSVCLPLLIFPCTIKSRSSLLALVHLGGPGKRAVKRLCVCV